MEEKEKMSVFNITEGLLSWRRVYCNLEVMPSNFQVSLLE